MIYVTKNFSTFGKEFPSMGPTRFQKVPGRVGTIARAGEFAYRYIVKHRNAITAISTLPVGAGVTGIGTDINESTNSFKKAYSPTFAIRGGKRNSNKFQRCHCSCSPRRKYKFRGNRRFRY